MCVCVFVNHCCTGLVASLCFDKTTSPVAPALMCHRRREGTWQISAQSKKKNQRLELNGKKMAERMKKRWWWWSLLARVNHDWLLSTAAVCTDFVGRHEHVLRLLQLGGSSALESCCWCCVHQNSFAGDELHIVWRLLFSSFVINHHSLVNIIELLSQGKSPPAVVVAAACGDDLLMAC